VFVTD